MTLPGRGCVRQSLMPVDAVDGVLSSLTMHRHLLCLLVICSLASAERAAAAPEVLKVFNREVATFRVPVGLITPSERVDRARARIAGLTSAQLAGQVTVEEGSIEGVPGAMLFLDGTFLFLLADTDLDATTGEARPAARQRVAEILREAFQARLDQADPGRLARSIGFSLAATAVAAALIAVLLAALGWLSRHVAVRAVGGLAPVKGIDIRPLATGIIRGLLWLPLWAGIATVGYVWLTLVLGWFPLTSPWSATLGHWLAGFAGDALHAVAAAMPGLFVVVVIALITRWAVRGLSSLFAGVEEGRIEITWMHPETARASRRIASVLLWLFAITIAYPYLPGSSSEAFKGVSVFAGLMLTLGSTGMINQVVSGLVVVYARTMRLGDVVRVGEVSGTVIELGFLSTKVRTPQQTEVTIPNAVLVGTTVTNYSRQPDGGGSPITAAVTIGYDTPWRQVHALLVLAAGRTPGIRATPAPEVVQHALDDFYVAYELRARIDQPERRFAIQSALHGQIMDAFNEHGVQIMSPHFNSQPAGAIVVPKGGWAPPPAAPLPS